MTGRFNVSLPVNEVANIIYRALYARVAKRNCRFELSPDVRKQIMDIANWLVADDSKPWLFLAGNVGNGKSRMLEALKDVFIQLNLPNFDEWGHPYDSSSYMGNSRPCLVIRSAKDIFYESRNGYESFKRIMKIPMLAIDDLGTEPVEIMDYGTSLTPMVDLISYRYEEQLFTAFSTNLLPEKIRSNYGDRIADRFNEIAQRIVYNNTSFRSPAPSSFPKSKESKGDCSAPRIPPVAVERIPAVAHQRIPLVTAEGYRL